jgi:hypothetical protein
MYTKQWNDVIFEWYALPDAVKLSYNELGYNEHILK